jgi:hypothetical protein
MTNTSTGGQSSDLDQLVSKLTEAIQGLANGPRRDTRDDSDDSKRRLHERIDFGYRALGTMMGRVSRTGAEFDVPVFAARWQRTRSVIRLRGLPDEANCVELRFGKQVEVVEVFRFRPGSARADIDRDAEDGERELPRISPEVFTPDGTIGSMVARRYEYGRAIAFGPRLAPRPSRQLNVT